MPNGKLNMIVSEVVEVEKLPLYILVTIGISI